MLEKQDKIGTILSYMQLEGKKVVILGAGLSGLGCLKQVLKKNVQKVWIISQGHPKSWASFDHVCKLISYEYMISEENVERYPLPDIQTLIIKSPGISWDHPMLVKAKITGTQILGEVDFAASLLSIPIIAITGTNGKTTTVSMLMESFKAAGIKTWVGGNIGTPLSDLIGNEQGIQVVILELSSFQLEKIHYLHPRIAAILNLSPSHSERYKTFEEYGKTKWEITRNQTAKDLLLIPPGLPFAPKKIASRVIEVTSDFLKEGPSFKDFQPKGKHNLNNLAFCWKILESCNKIYPWAKNLEKGFQEMLVNFRPLSHRIEEIRLSTGEVLYNDSKSTNWSSTCAALEALRDMPAPFFLILGGALRGGDEDLPPHEFFSLLEKRVDRLFFYGESGNKLWQEISWRRPCSYEKTLEEICSKTISSPGGFKTLLFSPGFPSFDQFDNYIQRGEAFKTFFV